MAVAVFKTGPVIGEVVGHNVDEGIQLKVNFTKVPSGKHGFHIHTAGDLRGEGCQGACAHWSKTSVDHGSYDSGHTGDLGNIEPDSRGHYKHTYLIKGATVDELWGRTIIVHEDEDDLGLGGHNDSKTTGHSGKRIACAIFGRMKDCDSVTFTGGGGGGSSHTGLIAGSIAAIGGLSYFLLKDYFAATNKKRK